MAEVPQIPAFAKVAMSQPKATGSHPDASLITGFIERSLTSPLRTQMLEHLAGCPQCRNLVFLATPQNAPAAEPQKTFSLAMPRFRYAFRWAAAAASAAVIAGAIWLANPIVANKQNPSSNPTVAMNTAPAANVADQNAVRSEASTPAALANKPNTVRRAPAPARRLEAEKPSATEAVASNATAPVPFDPRSMYQTSLSTSVNNGTTTPKAVVPGRPGMQYMISGPGTVYRSADKGRSWQSVDNIKPGLAVISSNGPVVMAGTGTGQLYRSNDNATTWAPVTTWSGTGSIIKIDIQDAQNVTVETAQGSWMSSDGCLTWHKQ